MTATEPTVDETIAIRNPANGTQVGSIPVHGPSVVAEKAARLRTAQQEWEAIGPVERGRWLRQWQDWAFDNVDHLTDVLISETGKSRRDAGVEIVATATMPTYWADNAATFLKASHPKAHSPLYQNKRFTTWYRPHQLVGVISPWNFPFALPCMDGIPALAAGAAVLLKPSEVTPLSGLEIVRGWNEIGAPPVLDVVTGYGATGAAVIDNVDYLQFTGSTGTGRRVAVACAERLIPFGLELGGKDPAIVLADADLERAANGVLWGGLFNSGQVCVSVERVFVEAPVYDEFVAKLTEKARSVSQGAAGDIGAMATDTQRDIVARHVGEATAAGARVLTGGEPTGVGTYFAPTVLADVDPTMTCMTEETFGPTIPVIKVADEHEAIRLANQSEYGLSASVWTGDVARGERIATRLEVGAVNVNDAMTNIFCPNVPMAGWKESGLGHRAGGAAGLLKYCRPQAITAPRTPTMKSELLWYPATDRKTGMLLKAMRLVNAQGWKRKFGR